MPLGGYRGLVMGVVSGKFAAMLECSLAKPDPRTWRVWNQNCIQFCR